MRKAVKSNLLVTLVFALALAAAGEVMAQKKPDSKPYPSRPLRFLVPYAAAGPTDIMARLVGQKLSERWGQNVVIDNRAGASGNIGTALVMRSNPDGYTILVHSSAYVVNPSLYTNAGYDAATSLIPIINAGASPNMLYVHPSFQVHSLKELIANAKGKSYASPGIGTTPHLTVELLLKTMNKLDLTHVPYNGAAPALAAVLGGQLPIGCGAMPPIIAPVKAGRLRAIAVTSLKRAPSLPEVPTVAESGFPGYEDYTWIAAFAPAGTPRAIVDTLNTEIDRVLWLPDVKERLAVLAFEYTPNTPQQFAEYVRKEVAKWGKVVKSSGARVD
jgi:tripartite-type tricarboxylate transporter receptor subunit TctC